MGFDKKWSLEAFKVTLYPLLRANSSGCHCTENRSGSGAQAPLHVDTDVNLAHEYAPNRVNFREPENWKFVCHKFPETREGHLLGGRCASRNVPRRRRKFQLSREVIRLPGASHRRIRNHHRRSGCQFRGLRSSSNRHQSSPARVRSNGDGCLHR
jgi:hypothetical protein